jgi:hypothetical protein
MKKALTILITAVFMLSLAACGGGNDNENTPTSGENGTAATQDEAPTEEPSPEDRLEELQQRLVDASATQSSHEGRLPANFEMVLAPDLMSIEFSANTIGGLNEINFTHIEAVNTALGFPSSVMRRIEGTAPADGWQEHSITDFTVRWNFTLGQFLGDFYHYITVRWEINL